MSWQKIVAQVVITGSQIIGKAFLTAYRQAAANAGKDAVKAAGGVVRRGQMTESEALEILNVKKLPDGDLPPREELEAYYVKYFEANDPKNGGSYYLQSKFFRPDELAAKGVTLDSKLAHKRVFKNKAPYFFFRHNLPNFQPGPEINSLLPPYPTF